MTQEGIAPTYQWAIPKFNRTGTINMFISNLFIKTRTNKFINNRKYTWKPFKINVTYKLRQYANVREAKATDCLIGSFAPVRG